MDMRQPEHGRVLIFKDHPPKTMNAPLEVARQITYPLPKRSAKSIR